MNWTRVFGEWDLDDVEYSVCTISWTQGEVGQAGRASWAIRLNWQ